MAAGDIAIDVSTASQVWDDTTGGGVLDIDLISLADTAGKAGDEWDQGSDILAPRLLMVVEFVFQSGPAVGTYMELFWAAALATGDFPAGLTATVASFNDAEAKQQLIHLGNMQLDNTTTQRMAVLFDNPSRFGLPVVINQSGQTLSASNDVSFITVQPQKISVQ